MTGAACRQYPTRVPFLIQRPTSGARVLFGEVLGSARATDPRDGASI